MYKISTIGSTHPKSGQGGGRKINTNTSWLNQGGGAGTGFHGKSTMKDGRSSQSQIADKSKSFIMNTERTAFCVLCIMNGPLM